MKYVESGANLSPCGQYRYALTRKWGYVSRAVCWVMLNPSTADHAQDDATIRRVVRFSIDWGFHELVVVNLFALRSRNPAALRGDRDRAVGPNNDDMIRSAVLASSTVVCAWGVHGHLYGRDHEVRRLIQSTGIVPNALSLTKDGAPGHPLYVPKSTKPQPLEWLS